MKKIDDFLKKIMEDKKINLRDNAFNRYHQLELKPVYVVRDERSIDHK